MALHSTYKREHGIFVFQHLLHIHELCLDWWPDLTQDGACRCSRRGHRSHVAHIFSMKGELDGDISRPSLFMVEKVHMTGDLGMS